MKTNILLMMTLLMSTLAYSQTFKYTVDTKQSEVIWTARKVSGEHTGNVLVKSGNFTVEKDMISKGEFVVDMNSITDNDLKDESYNKQLVGHLKSADFFETDKYPEAKLIINSSEKSDGEFFIAKGTLSIKDVTLPYTFKYAFRYDKGLFIAMSNMQVDRSKYNVQYGSESFFKNLEDKVIYDNIDFQVKIIGKPL